MPAPKYVFSPIVSVTISGTGTFTNPNGANDSFVLDIINSFPGLTGIQLWVPTGSPPPSQGPTNFSVSLPSSWFAHIATATVRFYPQGTLAFGGANNVGVVTGLQIVITYQNGSSYSISASNFSYTQQDGTILNSLTATSVSLTQPAYGGLVQPYGFAVWTYTPPTIATPAWYLPVEPGLGPTDRSTYVSQQEPHNGNLQARQRGTMNYTLQLAASNSYAPTQWQPVFFFDQTQTEGWVLIFAGYLQSFKPRMIGGDGYRFVDCVAISLECVFDQVMVTTPMQFVNQNCGAIVTAILAAFLPFVPLGTVQNGVTIPLFNAQVGDKISDLLNQLATTSEFTWNYPPSTQEFFFGAPTTVAAPFSIVTPGPNSPGALGGGMWESLSYDSDGADYRNRQAVKLSYDAFPHSMEFFAGAGQKSFTLMRPVKQVVTAYITLSTCNSATAAFSGQPADGDTFTIGPASGAWQMSHVYGLGGVIVVNGFVQKVTTAGTSGGSIPTFSTVTGQTTTDNTVIWTCQGPLGLGTGNQTYTFKSTIDNTQFGQILIGSTLAATVQNAVDCINANASTRGTGFSLPTWENSQVNAVSVTGTGFTAQQKAAGTGWVAALSATGSAFSWSAANTSGGTSPQGSVGPNEGATITIQVYQQGTSTAAPGLAYTEGSATITLATPLNVGTNLNVEYTREDGNVIQCERTDLVTALAAEMGTGGQIQQITDASTLGLISVNPDAGLQLCQQALASFDVVPESVELDIINPGIFPNQVVTLALSGFWSLLNGDWYCEELRINFVPYSQYQSGQYLLAHTGHYRYTLKLINLAQIGSYLDWWLQKGGTGGGGSTAPLVATSGGALGTQGQTTILSKYTQSFSSATSVTVSHDLNTTAVTVQVFSSSGVQVIPDVVTITDANTVTLAFTDAFTGTVVVIG